MDAVHVKLLRGGAKLPSYGTAEAAGADLYAYLNGSDYVAIPPHATIKVGTGVAMAIPTGYYGGLYARSGLATKNGLAPANKVGIIDADYRGEIIVALHNDSGKPQTVRHGDRIAQLIISPVPDITYEVTAELDDTVRGEGGFGHTGV